MKNSNFAILLRGYRFPAVLAAIAVMLVAAALFVWNAQASRENAGADRTLKMNLVREDLDAPRLLDYHAPTNNFVIGEGDPRKLRLVTGTSASDLADYLQELAITEPQSITTNRGEGVRFNHGDIFAGLAGGRILHISSEMVKPSFITLPKEASAVDGGMIVDSSGVFDNELIAATRAGRVWQIDGKREPKLLADLGSPLRGVSIVPNDMERYGALAGKLIVGSTAPRGFYSIGADGQSSFNPLNFKPADIDLITAGENLFAISAATGRLWGLGSREFSDHEGDLLIASAESNELALLHFDGGSVRISTLTIDERVDQTTFAPVPVSETGPCVTSVSPIHNAFQWTGGIGGFTVTAPPNCNWTAVSSGIWVEVLSGQSGMGNGTVTYSAAKNQTYSLRQANVTVGAFTHTVSQSRKAQLHCNVSLTPAGPVISAIGGAGTINVAADPDCAWSGVSDSPWLTLGGNVGTGNGTISYSASTNFAGQSRAAVISFPGLTGYFAQLTQGPNLAPVVNAGQNQSIDLPSSASLSGNVTDDGVGSTVTALWSKISGPESVVFSNVNNLNTSAIFSTAGTYVLRLTASDGFLDSSDDIQITVNTDPVPPPPDPATVAPPINPTVATNAFEATKFLYTGSGAIQTGVAPGTIKEDRVAVLRGRVVSKAGQPLSKAKITVLDHPELGQTLTRADGMFDIVVNGGGELNVKYEKSGFVPVQRKENPQWQEYERSDDVVMIAYDGNVTFIDLNSSVPIQTAQSGIITDASGTRRSRLFFKQGTAATMRLPGGSTQQLTAMNVRSSEFTVGANGPETMPGDLPPLSAYTYASEYSVDEAVAAAATEVTFTQPVVQYNENFLGFPVGTVVPSGSFDKVTGIWMPSASGRVVKILSITANAADLDVNGAGVPATDPEYAALGIDPAERERLAALYSVNQSLWRVPLIHFTPWDSNWPFGPPSGGGPPNGGNAGGGGNGPPAPPQGPCKKGGCIISVEDQVLSEEIEVVGTPYFLRYDSNRPRGSISNYTARIPLNGATLPGPVKRVDMKVTIAGQMHEFTFPAAANQTTTFTWDGLDAYGRGLQGQQEVTIDTSNVYDGVYQNTSTFGYNGNGVPISGDPTRQEVSLHRIQRLMLGTNSAPPASLGGWSLSEQHSYDPVGQKLYEGNGRQRGAQTVSNAINAFAGGLSGYLDGPTDVARFNRPVGIAAAADGTVYVADTANQLIRKIAPDGMVSTFAGNGGGCNPFNFPCGDGGPAINASFGAVIRVSVARDGSIIIGGGRNVWSVGTDGIFRRLAGIITSGFSGDGGQAKLAQLSDACRPFPAADGSIYLADTNNFRIRRIDPTGIITTIAGTGTNGFSGDGGPATAARIGPVGDLAIASDGTIYFIDQFPNSRIRRIGTDGIITTYAGNGTYGFSGDGGPAITAAFAFDPISPVFNGSMAIGPDDSLYVVSYPSIGAQGRIRKITRDGIVNSIAGNGQLGSLGDGGPALQSPMNLISIAMAPNGSIYTLGGGIGTDFDESKIRRISSPLPGFDGSAIAIASEDGSQLFRFDAQGRHLNTVNTYTGTVMSTFNYDTAGRLTSIVDGDGNTTTVERSGSGNPTGILSPYNQRTTLSLDANGFIASVTNPAGEADRFTYNAGGLMLTARDPRGNQSAFTYDALGRLTRDDDPAAGFQTLIRADSGAGFTVSHNTALNHLTLFQVNSLANGDSEVVRTFGDGTQHQQTNRANGTTTYIQPEGSVMGETRSGEPRWKFQSPLITATSVATTSGLTFNATYQRAVSLATPNDPLSLTSQTDIFTANGQASTSVFTAATRTFVDTSPNNRARTTMLDLQGRPSQARLANLNPRNFGYDSRGRLTSITRGTGPDTRSAALAYNAQGYLSSYTNPLNQTLNLTYDLAGRVTTQSYSDGRSIDFAYNENGDLVSLTPPGRPAHTFTHNSVNLPASYTAPTVGGNSTTTYNYDLEQQLTRITRPDGLQMNYSYDPVGRLQTAVVPNGTYTFTYGAATGLLTGISAPGNNGALSFQYDGFLRTRSTWTGPVAGNVSNTFNNFFIASSQSINGGNTVNFAYDEEFLMTNAGSLSIQRDPQNGGLIGTTIANVTDTFGYDGFGMLSSHNSKFNATDLFNVTYAYDKLGRIVNKTETIGGGTNAYAFEYDTTGRLTSVTLNSAPQPLVTYAYDANDNRTSVTIGGSPTNASYDAQDRLVSYGSTTYAYTANGELQTKTNGANVTQYSYDVIGNLRAVTLPNGTQIEYVIDGLDRRIGKRVNGTLTMGLLYQDQLEPVAELDGNNNLVSRFVYGSRSYTPDYMIKGGATYRLISDNLGSIRLVVNVDTGAIAQRIDYDEFGIILQDTNPGFQPFGFAGGIYDPQTGLTRFGARDYDAQTGRWTTKDPKMFSAGDSNLYVYVSNSPIQLIDPTGFQGKHFWENKMDMCFSYPIVDRGKIYDTPFPITFDPNTIRNFGHKPKHKKRGDVAIVYRRFTFVIYDPIICANRIVDLYLLIHVAVYEGNDRYWQRNGPSEPFRSNERFVNNFGGEGSIVTYFSPMNTR